MENRISSLRPALLVGTGILMGVLMTISLGASSSGAQAPDTQVTTQANCQNFSQTGHKVCGKFLDYWKGHGGLAQQGYPQSEEFTETSVLNGKPYTVQYFERAVFEMHPENKAPYDVLLSQLGTFLGKSKYSQGFPATSGQLPFYEDRTDPVAALVSFYNAISRKEYERAYGYFRGAPNPDPSIVTAYGPWVQGYTDTSSVTVAAGKAIQDAGAGNIYASFPVVLTAKHTDGSTKVFSGCYFMHRVSAGISQDPNDELWSINGAKLAVALASQTVDQMLAQTCAQ